MNSLLNYYLSLTILLLIVYSLNFILFLCDYLSIYLKYIYSDIITIDSNSRLFSSSLIIIKILHYKKKKKKKKYYYKYIKNDNE